MKNIIFILFLIGIVFGCKKELVKEPNRLIEKEKMIVILHDLALLEAMRADNPAKMDSFKNTANQYLFKKHKIDSLQFAKSNAYYAADVVGYEKMYNEVKTRIEKQRDETAILVKEKAKKDSLNTIKKNKFIRKRINDSIKNKI